MIKKFLDASLQLLPLVLLVLVLVAVLLVSHQGTAVTARDSVAAAVQAMLSLSGGKFLYRTSEAKAALGCGTTKLYDLINSGVLETRRFGKRTYITAASLEAFVASLPPVVTPTMAKAEHDRWSRHRRPRPKTQEDEPGAAE
jgi:Helix-turn-helix domain